MKQVLFVGVMVLVLTFVVAPGWTGIIPIPLPEPKSGITRVMMPEWYPQRPEWIGEMAKFEPPKLEVFDYEISEKLEMPSGENLQLEKYRPKLAPRCEPSFEWSEPVDSTYEKVIQTITDTLENSGLTPIEIAVAQGAINAFLAAFLPQFPELANVNVTMQIAEAERGTLLTFDIEGYGTIAIGPDYIHLNFVEKGAALFITWSEGHLAIYPYEHKEKRIAE